MEDLTEEQQTQLLVQVLEHDVATVFVEPDVNEEDLKKMTTNIIEAKAQHKQQNQDLQKNQQAELQNLLGEYIYLFSYYQRFEQYSQNTEIRTRIRKDFHDFTGHFFPPHTNDHTIQYLSQELGKIWMLPSPQ